jgi:hypothetical protein
MSLNRTPLMIDRRGNADRVAMQIVGLDPRTRPRVVQEVYGAFAAIAVLRGQSDAEAADFANEMQRLITDRMRAIELSGGSRGGCA